MIDTRQDELRQIQYQIDELKQAIRIVVGGDAVHDPTYIWVMYMEQLITASIMTGYRLEHVYITALRAEQDTSSPLMPDKRVVGSMVDIIHHQLKRHNQPTTENHDTFASKLDDVGSMLTALETTG